MSSLNLKTCCIPLTVWVTAEVVLQLGIEGPKRAQGLGLQKMDPVLLSTSASNEKRQCSVFSRLIFLLGLWRPSARPFTMWWVCKSDWVSSMECGQEVIWASHFCSGHAQHSSDDFSGSFFFQSAFNKDLQISEAAEDTGTIKETRRNWVPKSLLGLSFAT